MIRRDRGKDKFNHLPPPCKDQKDEKHRMKERYGMRGKPHSVLDDNNHKVAGDLNVPGDILMREKYVGIAEKTMDPENMRCSKRLKLNLVCNILDELPSSSKKALKSGFSQSDQGLSSNSGQNP